MTVSKSEPGVLTRGSDGSEFRSGTPEAGAVLAERPVLMEHGASQNPLRKCPFSSSLQNEMMIIESLLCQALYGNISFNSFTIPYRLVLLNTCSTDGQTQEEEVSYPRSLRKD